ncbi:hypothetical protein PENTCL1PPCAC_26544 [Pristionchus entomophagus]|uniref:Core Histone H2A/H2B/H3 domain-containing protein n=1 Tax=Pristionchus entomophagus TaxID=358040 RepID=A0AAV5UBU0_9BILA|nr:hypothetical protein PENTCL1PPCAC_26544 [Pristionchus entomophagus]
MARTKQTARKVSAEPMGKQEKRLSQQLRTKRDTHRSMASMGKSSTQQRIKKAIPKKRGAGVLKDIRRYQRTGELLIPRFPFRRIVREIMERYNNGQDPLRIQSLAVDALQEAAEAYLVNLFEDANMAAIHARRVTIMPKDLDLVRKIRREL